MIRGVAIQRMPRPDAAEFPWDPDRVCVIVGDDAPLATALSRRLTARAWRVEVLSDTSATGGDLDARLASLGPIGGLISIAPRTRAGAATTTVDEILGGTDDDAWLLAQFRLARRLSADLQTLGAARSWFVAVTRIDGALGMASSPAASSVVAAGVYGLIKTLRLEWPSVFCRAIDLAPRFDAAFAAERIVEELHDPDQTLAEVGHGPDGRVSIAVTERVDD